MNTENAVQAAWRASLASGQDLAEMELEARRDAHELQQCPYTVGTFEALVFMHERTKMWRKEHGI